MLHILSEKKKRAFYEENIGLETKVLFENDIEEGQMHGFTDNYIRVAAKYDPLLIYDIKKAVIESINQKGLAEIKEAEVLGGGWLNLPKQKRSNRKSLHEAIK